MADEFDQERSLPATPRRLEQAREEGNVARSRELPAALALALCAAAAALAVPAIGAAFQSLLRRGLAFERADAYSASAPGSHLFEIAYAGLLAAGPLMLTLAATALLGGIAVGGWLFTMKGITLDLTRLSPASGLSRILSLQGLAGLGTTLLKALTVGVVVGWFLWSEREALASLAAEPLDGALRHTGAIVAGALTALAVGVVAVAAVEVPYVLWRHASRLRMTAEEVRRETRESEGNPQIKARVRNVARELARRRMMAAVPKADVVITNPTHFAVALAYHESRHRAPTVVAKGRSEIAARIREIAVASGVPMVEAPPLARALYRVAEIGDEIPISLYNAVAQVLAYVFQLRQWRAGGRGPAPRAPQDLEVPPGLDPDTAGDREDDARGDAE